MCLAKLSMMPRIAKRDIVVYKIAEYEYGTLFSPFQYNVVKIGKTQEAEGLNKRELFLSLFKTYIDEGYIHAYRHLNTARRYAYVYTSTHVKMKVIECIIPKGTLYFIGTGNEIASRKLSYVRILE